MGYSATQFMSYGGQGQNTDVDQVAEALASSTTAKAVLIKALEGNTGVVYVNFSTTATTANGFPLGAGDDTGWIPVHKNNLNNISLIASADNQAVAYVFLV